MIAEAMLPNGIAVALNNSPSSVAFVFRGKQAFIDNREGMLAIWDRKGFTLDGKEYVFHQWHTLNEGESLYKYMKDLISKDYVNPLEGMQEFFSQQQQ